MTRPHDFGFGEEAQILRDSARRLLRERCPTGALHRLVAADHDAARARACVWDADLWRRMVELGWPAVAVPAAAGGFGMGLAAVAGLAEEIGRAAAPSPWTTTTCAAFVAAVCAGDGARALLGRVAAGEAVALAGVDRRGAWGPGDTEVVADAAGRLTGTAWFVQDARKCASFLITARTPAGPALYAVAADAPGVRVVPDAIVDPTRDQARVELGEVVAEPIAGPGEAEAALRTGEAAILTILAADMVGAAEWQLQTTAEYARTRVQFERPIGFFQAVKHPLVDMMLKIDAARSLVWDAACAFDHEPATALLRARMAKAAAGDAASFCSGRSVQLHGGVGFTWECFVQLYYKRQRHSEALYGDSAHQRACLADLLIGPIGGGA